MPRRRSTVVQSCLHQFIPVCGATSGIYFSTYVMSPTLFRNLVGPKDMLVANCLWFNAHLGAGMYIYNRKHLRNATPFRRILYSSCGAVMFNFGSVLVWAASKTLFPPDQELAKTAFGLLSSIFLYLVGREYLLYLDANCKPKETGKSAGDY